MHMQIKLGSNIHISQMETEAEIKGKKE